MNILAALVENDEQKGKDEEQIFLASLYGAF